MIRTPRGVLGALAAAGLLLCASACRRGSSSAPEQPQQTFKNLSLNQSNQGQKTWSLGTPAATFDQGRLIADLASPKMDFYKNGRLSSTLTADSGVLHTQTRNVHLEGHVVARAFSDKTVLKTSALDYFAKIGKFVTHERVVISRPSGTVRGDGMEADSDFSRIKIFHQRSVIR
ncbi:MAG: LPS export ABC transporter periplasmic protein LptC [Elusimicrobia bacterium]|nr:LPS export ABC transporter periplasmic protein LptC [Elusimicrobiota bacterium]